MGFFSWDCKGCDESIKAPHGIPKQMAWQNECVATNGENTIKGEYDGYGTVGGIDIADVGDSYAFYHRRCWDKPGDFIFDKPSQPSNDQGYFYDTVENELNLVREVVLNIAPNAKFGKFVDGKFVDEKRE